MSSARGDVARFARSSAIYAAGNAISRVGAFVLLPVYTRFLAVAEYGQLELFAVIASIASGLLSVGIAHATLRFYYEYKDEADRHAVVSTNLLASFAIASVGVALIAVWSREIAVALVQDAALTPGVWLVLATLVLELSSQVALAYVRAAERALLFVAVSVGKLLVQVGVNTAMLAVYDAGVLGVLAGNFATVLVSWLVLVGFTLRHCGLRFEWAKLRPVLLYGYPFLLTTIVALVSSNVDRLLITGLLSLQALGIYALATKFASLLQELVGEPFNQAYGAFRFTIMGKDGAAELQARIVRYLLIVACVAGLGLAYFVDLLLVLLATPAYREAATYVPLLALAAVVRLVSYPVQTGILYQKHTRHVFHVSVAAAMVNAAAGVVLIAWLGILGACLTVLLSALASLVLTNHFAQRYFPVRYEWRRLAVILGLALAFGALGFALRGRPLWTASALEVALLALYALAVMRWGLAPGELDHARALVRRRFGSRPGSA